MANPRVIRWVWRTVAVLSVIGVLVAWGHYQIGRIPIPKREKLADCTSTNLSFPMTVRHHDPYHLVLGLPRTATGEVHFRGEVEIRQGTQLVARIPISSEDITPCNWLERKPGLAGYILTWSRTNQGERLGEILAKGQSYEVQVSFSQSPPRESSLWLSSIGRVRER